MRYILFLLPAFIYANTTMCYKNNWSDPSTIEREKLDGGECKGEKSIENMKKDGWSVDDIKISSGKSGMNYIYILKQSGTSKAVTKDLNTEVSKSLVSLEKNKEAKQVEADLKEGERFYKLKCVTCHGEKGELKAKGTSRPINTLSIEEIETSVRGYKMDEYNRGLAILMKPYASFLYDERIKQIKLYLDSVNK